MKQILLLIGALLVMGHAQGQSAALSGKIKDQEGEPILFASIALYLKGSLQAGQTSDIDGNYYFSNLDAGTYDLEVSYVGYETTRVEGIQIFADKHLKLDVELPTEVYTITGCVVVYEPPIIIQDPSPVRPIDAKDIANMPTRDIRAIAATKAGVSSADEGEELSFMGARTSSSNYYIDGMRVQHNLIPESEIEQLQVIAGGIEARYGDVTGGIVAITSKGPAKKLSAGLDLETSRFLDHYNNNIVGMNLSGPLIKKGEQSILGFRLAGRYTYQEDDDPSAVAIYRVKDDVLADLEENPLRSQAGNVYSAANFLTHKDVNILDKRPYEAYSRYDITAKLQARLGPAIDASVGASFSAENDQVTPDENSLTRASWRVFNAHNNPYDLENNYRVNARFRHKLSGYLGDEKNNGRLQNVNYTLQASYEKRNRTIEDPRHKDNYFNYGYIGKFDVDYIPVFEQLRDSANNVFLQHVDYREVLRAYDASNSSNPVLANYNNPFNLSAAEAINANQPAYAIQNVFGENDNLSVDNLYAINGRVSDIYDNSWGLHANVGTVFNRSLKQDNQTLIFNASTSFEIVPRGGGQNRHSIQFGLSYEDRTNRQYELVDPSRLWTAARQNANVHIQGIDAASAVALGTYSELYTNPDGSPASVIAPFEDPQILSLSLSANEGARFYKEVREALGIGLGQYVNIDALAPEQLSMSMFAAKELNDQFILDYYGYDYLGNEFNGSFEDFFTTRDAQGVRSFPVAPSRPLYTAVYLQDKFTFRDMIFRLGVRMDRYDANTKVLQDPYSLYAIQGASDFHSQYGGERPGGIQDNFKVYTTIDDGTEVQAYRNGDDWFHADGTPANGAQEIEGIRTGLVFPKYKDEKAHTASYIKSEDFDLNASFKDYEVQVNVMPRLAFSFPISDRANFFAHYDVLVQRPPSNTIATALDYFYFAERSRSTTFNNPNLRPERTVDYKVGFQQALTSNSAVRIEAYYREMRDMIQLRTYFPVPIVNNYTTFDNQDFGTVKGFSFTYDMRRTGRLSLNANYTLQFADGTGSDAESQRGLTNRGNIRTLFPLNIDERHRFNLSTDYRFPKASGPRIGGFYLLAQTGFNIQAGAVSGRPYTAKQQAQELGGTGTVGAINGARKPWNTTLSLRVNRQFKLGQGLHANVYVRVSNLFNTKNTIDVYPVTASSEEDGFLSSSFGQDQIATIENSPLSLDAYLASYQWRILNSDFYSLPRRINLGMNISF